MDFEARYDMAILGSWSSKINTAATRLARLAVARGLWSDRIYGVAHPLRLKASDRRRACRGFGINSRHCRD